jgi:hypothetical protein
LINLKSLLMAFGESSKRRDKSHSDSCERRNTQYTIEYEVRTVCAQTSVRVIAESASRGAATSRPTMSWSPAASKGEAHATTPNLENSSP